MPPAARLCGRIAAAMGRGRVQLLTAAGAGRAGACSQAGVELTSLDLEASWGPYVELLGPRYRFVQVISPLL